MKEGCGIMLINQSDIFDRQVRGKWVKKEPKYLKDLLEYGEVLIAKIGTLGENETFCNTIFVNEDLVGQLTSSAFYRLKTNGRVPSGYLYAWLSSDYGFRLIRNTQYGTKQCYPNPTLLLNIPIPIVEKQIIDRIDVLVRDAHTKRYLANQKELQAISIIESEIESWS
jgi:restriction endonuclease S subunit